MQAFSYWSWFTIVSNNSICFSGESDLQSLASRVHPVFGIVFAIVLYLAIGPFYAIPRSELYHLKLELNRFYQMMQVLLH